MSSAELERALADPASADVLALQRTLVAAIRLYAARAEVDAELTPFPPPEVAPPPTATETLVVVSDLLEAAGIELFELGMWQTFGSVRP